MRQVRKVLRDRQTNWTEARSLLDQKSVEELLKEDRQFDDYGEHQSVEEAPRKDVQSNTS